MEVLEHTPTPARRRPVLALVVVGVVVLAVLGAIALDSWQRDRESLAVQTAYAQAVAAIETAQDRVRGTVTYASPLLQVGPAQVRAALEDLVLEEIDAGLVEYERARQALLTVTVWPWHGEVLDQRAALVADLDDRARSLTLATGQGLFVP